MNRHDRHPARFRHAAATRKDVGALNEVGYLAVSFRAIGDEPPRLIVNGARQGRLIIWRTVSHKGFQTLAKEPLDVLSIRLPLNGSMIRRNWQADYIAGPRQAMILPFDIMRDVRCSDDIDVLSCSFARATLHQLNELAEDGRQGPLDFEPVVDIKTPGMRMFARTLENVFDWLMTGAADRDLTFPLLEELLLGQLLTSWPRRPLIDGVAVYPARRRHVRDAIDYIQAHLASPIYVADIARAVGTNIRSLQLAFRQETGETLVRHILGQRLKRVRDDLLRGNARQVAEAAHRWGFINLSAFSRLYRAQFGELPSATLSKQAAN